MNDVFAEVRAAIASGNADQMERAERALRTVGQALSPAHLPTLHRLQPLLHSATEFYSGLTATMKIQLQGYGNGTISGQPQSGKHFTVEA